MKGKLKIFYVSPEVAPFAGTTDLADIASAYPKYLKAEGHDIRVMMPNYRTVNERKYVLRDVIRLKGLKIKLGGEELDANGKSAFIPNSKVQIYFLDNRKLFESENQYQDSSIDKRYQDNAKRFIFFSIGCLETLKLLYWQPDIIHCNDWQTALIPFLLKTTYGSDPFFKNTRTVFSIHNPKYYGLFNDSITKLTGVKQSLFGTDSNLLKKNNFSFLDSGVKFADGSNTTKKDFAVEDLGDNKGLNATIKKMLKIQNGIDWQIWNPETDKLIPSNYTLDSLSGKLENKNKLLQKFGMDSAESVPVISMVLGDTDERSVNLLIDSIDKLINFQICLIFSGSASSGTEEKLKGLKEKYSSQIGVALNADPKLSHLIEAGSDLLLATVPRSLNQMHSQRYGTIPIVFDEHKPSIDTFDAKKGTGVGFSFNRSDAKALLKTVKDAISIYENREQWHTLMKNAMDQDFSWETRGQAYVQLYVKLMNSKVKK